jgi:hypothetical protein
MPTHTIHNVHERRFSVPAAQLGVLLDAFGSDSDRLWPSTRWPAVHVEHPIRVGDLAYHATVKYFVDVYEPGKSLWFQFDPAAGLEGRHGLEVLPQDDGTTILRHTLEGRAVGKGERLWPLMIRPCHDQLVEELLDNAERQLPKGSRVQQSPAERVGVSGYSAYGRFLRQVMKLLKRVGLV